jgi:DNA-binding MarR family transcriptional regulator
MNVNLDVHRVNDVASEPCGSFQGWAARTVEPDNSRIVLSLLQSVERDGAQSQRKLASELGIALGLVNAYLKRCVKKGLLKVGQAPARRYAYYLTPRGFAEKSRLTVEYLSSSFSFFRRAREDCSSVLAAARAQGWSRVVLIGVSDLAEIATICALEHGLTIVAVVDANSSRTRFVGMPVADSLEAVAVKFDAVLLTDLQATRELVMNASAQVGASRLLIPQMLETSIDRSTERTV